MTNKILKAACLLPLVVALCQCAPAKPKGPSPYASSVRMAFTPMAMAALTQAKDSFVVVAYYYGDPTPAAQKNVDDVGRLALGEDRDAWALNTHLVHLAGNIDTSLLSQVRDAPQVLITAHASTPIGGDDDILHCKTWIGTVKNAQEKPPLIACELENGDKDSADDIVAADDASSSQ